MNKSIMKPLQYDAVNKSLRTTSILAGVFFLLGYAGIFAGGSIYGPVIDGPFNAVYTRQAQLISGMFVELINDAAVLGIAVALYPVFRKFNPFLAFGYAGMRIIEAILLIISKVSILALIPLSRAAANGTDKAVLESIRSFALSFRFWCGKYQTVFFILGAVILYIILFRSRLLPRFISVWGFIAIAALAAANLGGVPDPTQGFSPAVLLYFPIMISEFLVAGWLIFKGFNVKAIKSAD